MLLQLLALTPSSDIAEKEAEMEECRNLFGREIQEEIESSF